MDMFYKCLVVLSLFGIIGISYVYGQTSPMCYVCRSQRSNFACNKKAERCATGLTACETSVSVSGTGHIGLIRKGCVKDCSSGRNRARSCSPPGCSYCCTGDLCNAGVSRTFNASERAIARAASAINRRNRAQDSNTNTATENQPDDMGDNMEMSDNAINTGMTRDDMIEMIEERMQKDPVAFTVVSEAVKHMADAVLLNVSSIIENRGEAIKPIMNTTEIMADKADGNGITNNIDLEPGRILARISKPLSSSAIIDRTRNMPVIINNSPIPESVLDNQVDSEFGIYDGGDNDQDEDVIMENGDEIMIQDDRFETTTLPTDNGNSFQAMFTVLSNDVMQSALHELLNVSHVVVNIGDIIRPGLETSEFTLDRSGIYVFHVTSVATGPGLVATPLVLLKNEQIVMTTGKSEGPFITSFPIGVGHVTLSLEIGDTIRLMTSPKGMNPVNVYAASSQVTFSGYMIN